MAWREAIGCWGTRVQEGFGVHLSFWDNGPGTEPQRAGRLHGDCMATRPCEALSEARRSPLFRGGRVPGPSLNKVLLR